MAKTATATPVRQDQLREGVPQQESPRQHQIRERSLAGCKGFEGTISPTLVNKTRVKMNLTDKLRVKTRSAARGKAAHNMPKTATATPGKTSSLRSSVTVITKATPKR